MANFIFNFLTYWFGELLLVYLPKENIVLTLCFFINRISTFFLDAVDCLVSKIINKPSVIHTHEIGNYLRG